MTTQTQINLSETWHIRARFIYVKYAVINVLKSRLGALSIILYWAIVLIPSFVMLFMNYKNINEKISTYSFLFYYIIFMAILFISAMYFSIRPKGGVGKIIRSFSRIKMVNKAGETPLLISRKRDRENPKLEIWIFRNCGFPIGIWSEDLKDEIESALNINIISVEEFGKQSIIIRCANGDIPLPKFVKWKNEYIPQKGKFTISLGETYTGSVIVDLAVTPHMLIGGSTGSGKSVLLKNLLYQCLKKQAQIIIADFKGGVDFSKAWHEKCEFIIQQDKLIEELNKLVIELHRRRVLLADSDCPNIDIYNVMYNQNIKRILFACDEVAELLDKTGLEKAQKQKIAEIESSISTIARLGRAFGIHLILATQRPDANIISGQIKNNIDVRVCGRADDTLSMIILDKADANDKIPKNAQGRFLDNNDILFQGYWFDDSSF